MRGSRTVPSPRSSTLCVIVGGGFLGLRPGLLGLRGLGGERDPGQSQENRAHREHSNMAEDCTLHDGPEFPPAVQTDQQGGKSYTTPTLRQFLHMRRQFKRLRTESLRRDG